MVAGTLQEKMLLWGQLKIQIGDLENQIKDEVLNLKETQKFGRVKATYSEGRGSYAYDLVAKELNPSPDIIKEFTSESTDWRKVCGKIGIPEEVKKKFFISGDPYVSLKIEAK